MTYEEAVELQTKMKDSGFYEGKIDGEWGPKSEAAYEAYTASLEDTSNLDIAWSAKVSEAFVERVKLMCSNLKMDENGPDYMMSCMAWESGESFSPSIKNAAGSGACVDIETEILTQDGWKKYNEVNVGDTIYSVNYNENKLENDEILNLLIKESDNNYKLSSRSFNSLSTHDHRWYLKQNYYCRTDNTPSIQIRTTEEIVNLKSSHTYSIPHPNKELIDTITIKRKYPLELYTLIGLICGDGSINKERNRIEVVSHAVSNPHETALVENCINVVFPDSIVPMDNKKSGEHLYRWRFNKKESDFLINFFDVKYNSELLQNKFIKKLDPVIFHELDFEAASALMEGYLTSDGHYCKSNNTISFRNAEKEIINDFMHCAVLAGENPRMVIDERGGKFQTFPNGRDYEIRDIFTVYLRDTKYTSCANHQMKREKVTENITVWCPTTRNQNWIARRNGTVYITGNCGLIQFMPKTAKSLGTTTEALGAMTALEQLEYVEKYFKSFKGRIKSISDAYMTILWPKAVGKELDYVMFDKAETPTTYRQNSGVDINLDGKCTKAEAAAKVMQKYKKGMLPKNRRVIS